MRRKAVDSFYAVETVLPESHAMGIRYYAYPVDGEFIELARVSPRMFMSIDPLADAWGLVGERPEMLYLDKCWRELQDLFGAKADTSPRPAYELVRGEVVLRPDGWTPFVRTLDPDQVATIADDMVRVTEAEVVAWLESGASRMTAEAHADERQYMMQLLRDAQTFTALLARERRGLVYMIG